MIKLIKKIMCIFGKHKPTNIKFHPIYGVGDEEFYTTDCLFCGKHSTSDSDNNFKYWHKQQGCGVLVRHERSLLNATGYDTLEKGTTMFSKEELSEIEFVLNMHIESVKAQIRNQPVLSNILTTETHEKLLEKVRKM